LLLYQKSIIISNAITNPPAAITVDRARGNRGRGRSNYRNRRKSCSGFRNIIYNNNRGGPHKRGNSRKNGRKNYLRSS
jgi:hypothetical protein